MNMEQGTYEIESPANSRVRAWMALASRSERDATNTFLIEGRRETERATTKVELREVIWCPDLGPAPIHGDDRLTSVSLRVFKKLSRRQNPDGIAAVASTPSLSLSSFDPDSPALVLAADGVEKPGNIGAMLRTCDAFGASFLGSDLGTDLVNPNVIRSAQGSLFSVPSASSTRQATMKWCADNTTVLVAHLSGTSTLWEQDLSGPTTIVVGAEDVGVDSAWLDVGRSVIVPTVGTADSLNVSVTAGIFLAEATRQRQS